MESDEINQLIEKEEYAYNNSILLQKQTLCIILNRNNSNFIVGKPHDYNGKLGVRTKCIHSDFSIRQKVQFSDNSCDAISWSGG